MPGHRIVFRIHALKRLRQRKIRRGDVRRVLEAGEVIETYPDGAPFPARLVLGLVGDRPLHVVAADNAADNETVIIAVYGPDPTRWSPDFRRRKTS